MHKLLSFEVWFFVHCVIKQIVDRSQTLPIRYTWRLLRLWLPKARKVISSY